MPSTTLLARRREMDRDRATFAMALEHLKIARGKVELAFGFGGMVLNPDAT